MRREIWRRAATSILLTAHLLTAACTSSSELSSADSGGSVHQSDRLPASENPAEFVELTTPPDPDEVPYPVSGTPPVSAETPAYTNTTTEPAAYSITEKLAHRPTIPVFYPWPGDCGQELWYDCDLPDTPYSLVWISEGIDPDIASTNVHVSPEQRTRMTQDPDTLYLINEEWHYWNTGWRTLSPDSKFYLDEVYGFHEGSEYGRTYMINFEHPDWPGTLAEKAHNFQQAGFDGMMLDWWHNGAGNGRPEDVVEAARLEIARAIRERTGEDFILMGNAGWMVDDPTAPYLSGVFLELWKETPASEYALSYDEEERDAWAPSLERMEDLLLYWDKNLAWPKIIAFEPWKITTRHFIGDRTTEENLRWAELFAAMAVVIPENGYILYADNNDDWIGGDHQHAYYDFYHTDFGSPVSGWIQPAEGVGYRLFETGLVAYNRTENPLDITLETGSTIHLEPLEGLILGE